MNWDDDLLLEQASRERGQYQLAMYAIHLATGSSIYLRTLKPATIKQYVYAVSSFLAYFSGQDFRKDVDRDAAMGSVLGPVYRALDQFDSLPDRREPWTPAMQRRLESHAIPWRTSSPNGVCCTLSDWFALGLCAGFRLSEWAQPASHGDPLHPQVKKLGNRTYVQALLAQDVRICTISNQRAVGLATLQHPVESIRKVWITFRWQKNRQFGEERMFTRNPTPGGHCFVANMYRVLCRFQTLTTRDSLPQASTPLGIYHDIAHGNTRLITSEIIEAVMRNVVSLECGLDPVDDAEALQRWGSHSLRVGACVSLHAMGFSPLDIKWLLRWRSDAFMAYLRNIAILADRHNRALDRLDGMPHLI